MNIEQHYRPDINGLRAVAVLIILFFHAGYSWASGGFIGVDVFFVISGYLITRNIAAARQQNNFSFSSFYIRRVRRLFPALFFTLTFVSVASYLILPPHELERFGQSLLYATLSISNFFFWGETGYFDTASELKPLLHTWSLAIEEQFYLIWPAILILLFRFKKQSFLIIFLIFSIIASLYLNTRFLPSQPETVFFLLPFRVFEFSIGALCVWLIDVRPQNKHINGSLSLLGIILILWPATNYSNEMLFPGYAALLPAMGAALIIYAGKTGFSETFLSNHFMVKIGLISYSVYLVHWPLFVFYKYWKLTPIDDLERISLLLLSLMLGYLMWKFIETPFRLNKENKSSSYFLKGIFVLVFLLILLAVGTWKNTAWRQDLPAEYFMTTEEVLENRNRYWKNFMSPDLSLLRGEPNQKNIIVLGNSHAIDFIYALRQSGSKSNITFLNSTAFCFNFGAPTHDKYIKQCGDYLDKNLADPHWKTTDAIYLHDNWPKLDINNLEMRIKQFRALSSAPIYVLGPKMSYMKPIPQIVSARLGESPYTINEYGKQFELREQKMQINHAVKEMIEYSKIQDIFFIDILEIQCGKHITNCNIISPHNAKFLYFDKSHFTLQGATELGEKLIKKHPAFFD